MPDSIFQVKTGQAMMNARLNRVEGSIPYIRRATQVYSTSKVKAPSQGSVESTASNIQYSGQIKPAVGIVAVGNAFPFTIQGNFGFTATANSITLYWDGTNGSKIFVIKRTDGTSFTVPSGSMTVTGLQPSMVYGFLPYNKTTSQANLSFTVGDAGTPMFAFSPAAPPEFIAAANQNQDMSDNESITQNLIYYSTVAAGTSNGQGDPGQISPYSNVRDAPDSV